MSDNSERKFNVKNRSASTVVYRIPELNIRRTYKPGETKVIAFEELEKLSYIDGGRELMTNFLQIQSKEVTANLNIHTEPEYNMSEQDVVNLIRDGSLDQFLDTLDFAPMGIIDLIKDLAVKIPMNSMEKRMALKEKTGFDVTVALQHITEEKMEDNTSNVAEAPKQRRVKVEEEKPAGRRTTPNYKIVEEVTTDK